MIVGIDEVGRGPWAGPLVVGAVVLGEAHIDGLTDSKKISKAKRELLSKQILEQSSSCGLGWVSAREIDDIGLSAALTLATVRALEQITVPYHEIILDGTVNFLRDTGKGDYVTTLKKADLLIGAVSAASIIAKVARDDYMADCDSKYTGYGFASHVGYGTAMHRTAIKANGITVEHRRSFAPIAALSGAAAPSVPEHSIDGTNKQVGNMAEEAVALWLESKGHTVIERNWKTKFCEIDIIAMMEDYLVFVEVKHRRSADQGGGVAAITDRKLRQMRFAAQLFLASSKTQNARLAVVTTEGTSDIHIDQLIFIE